MKRFYTVTIAYRLWIAGENGYGPIETCSDDAWAHSAEHAQRLALADFIADPPGLFKTAGVTVIEAELSQVLAQHGHTPATQE